MACTHQPLALFEPLANMNKFPFLELPAELRVQIYTLLLTARSQPGARSSRNRRKVDAAILQVSRKLHSECLALLYGKNVFHAHPARLVSLPFLWDIGRPVLSPDYCRLIRRYYIEVRLDNDVPWDGEACAKAFSGLEELHIVAWQASFGTCGVQNLAPFTNVRRVRRVCVEGSSVQPALARWLEDLMQQDYDSVELPSPPELGMDELDLWGLCNR